MGQSKKLIPQIFEISIFSKIWRNYFPQNVKITLIFRFFVFGRPLTTEANTGKRHLLHGDGPDYGP